MMLPVLMEGTDQLLFVLNSETLKMVMDFCCQLIRLKENGKRKQPRNVNKNHLFLL